MARTPVDSVARGPCVAVLIALAEHAVQHPGPDDVDLLTNADTAAAVDELEAMEQYSGYGEVWRSRIRCCGRRHWIARGSWWCRWPAACWIDWMFPADRHRREPCPAVRRAIEPVAITTATS